MPDLQSLKARDGRNGLIHVYTGEGKGKTTASLGLALRAIGHGMNVCIVQFMKGSNYSGEFVAYESFLPQLHIVQFGRSCHSPEKLLNGDSPCSKCRQCFMPSEEDSSQAARALRCACEASKSDKYDLVILDEVNVALSRGFIPEIAVLELMASKSHGTELVLTGRGAPQLVLAAADLVTEMRPLKHPMNRGIAGRRGIEY